MRSVLAVLAITSLLLQPLVASAAVELWMFESQTCSHCRLWNAEVGGIYDRTAKGQQAPLRRIDIGDALPGHLSLRDRPRFTPTFVLVADGEEIGRIEGYPGEAFFWGLLDLLLAARPAVETDAARPAGR